MSQSELLTFSPRCVSFPLSENSRPVQLGCSYLFLISRHPMVGRGGAAERGEGAGGGQFQCTRNAKWIGGQFAVHRSTFGSMFYFCVYILLHRAYSVK